KKSEWHYAESAPTFFNITHPLVGTIEIFQKVNAVGHVEIKSRDTTAKLLEIKRDCSLLYTVEALIYEGIHLSELMKRIMTLMKMVYTGMKKEKITQIPDKIGMFLLTPEDSKNEIKVSFRKHLEFLLDDLQLVFSCNKIDKEEMDWIKEK